MTETKIFNNNEVLTNLAKETVENKINWTKGTVKILDDFVNNSFETLNQALADKDKIISDLETKLNQPLTNQELLFQLVKKLESEELMFWFEDEDNKLYLEDQTSEGGESRIYLFNLDIKDDKISVFYEKGEYWKEVNEPFKENFLKVKEKDSSAKLTKNQEHSSHQEAKASPQELQEQKDKKELTKIAGVLTSSIRSKPSSDVSYMAYLRPDNAKEKHSLEECERTKCQSCETPVIFRWVNNGHNYHELTNCEFPKKHWQKPNLKKGDKVLLEGKFASSDHSKRPSFTCYSYQIINGHGR